MCCNLQHDWITCVTYSPFAALSFFVVLSNFCHLLILCLISSSLFTLSAHPINVPALHTKQNNSQSTNTSQQTQNNSRIRGDLIALFKITHGLLKFPMASTFVYPTRQGLRGHAFKFHQQRCCTSRRQFAFTIRVVPFWNKLPAEIVNASSVKSFKALLDARWQSLFPEVPI